MGMPHPETGHWASLPPPHVNAMNPFGMGQPPWGSRDMNPCGPHDTRHPCRPLPSGQMPGGGFGGYNSYSGSYAPPMAPPMAKERSRWPDAVAWPPQDDIDCPPAKGPAGHCLPTPLGSLPTPAKASGLPPSDRSMINTFRDSVDYIDAGVDSEAEFMSSRSMPPSRRKGEGRSHRQREEASCFPCFIMC